MSKHKVRGLSLLAAGFLLLAAAGGLHLMQEQQDALAGENARILLQQLEHIQSSPVYAQPSPSVPDTTAPQSAPTMPEADYLGYAMLGTIRVPAADIELPVLSNWDYDLLDVAPCRYTGSIPDGDMILMGHNYKSHFSRLRYAAPGDEVEFVDAAGTSYRYIVDRVDILHKNDGEFLPSEHPLILFTCTRSGQDRIVLRCSLIQN